MCYPSTTREVESHDGVNRPNPDGTLKPFTKHAELTAEIRKGAHARLKRAQHFRRLGTAISAITTNDPNWREAITPNPWKVLKSAGFDVMQIDTRPGLTRRDES